MTNYEFSNEFDVLYNNITSNQSPGLNDYEKSVLLTKAQDEILKAYFDPRSNKTYQGYDGSEIRQIDFSKVTAVENYITFDPPLFDPRPNNASIQLKSDILIPINEYVIVDRDGVKEYLQVLPITYTEYRRLMSKPFKRPTKSQAWRLINTIGGGNSADLIIGNNDELIRYSIRYVRKPRPIILSRIDEEGLSIGDGYVGSDSNKNPTKDIRAAIDGIECELDPIIHPEILQRAVEFAKASYIGDLQSQVALGQASQTNIGLITQPK